MRNRVLDMAMLGTIRIVALTGFVILAAASAHAQGWYNYNIPAAPDPANAQSQSNPISFTDYFSGPGGGLYSTSVHGYSTNLGDGMSVSVVSMVSNGPAGVMSGLSGSSLVPGFPGSIATNYAGGLNLDPSVGVPASVAGRMSFNLGGGLSMDFLGAMSRGPGSGFYSSPFSPFSSGYSSMVGTGFTMNFGRGGSLSLIGSVSRSYGPCGGFAFACR
ncbi:MAG: hypothetical protein KGO48_04650 [Alphaproteobacteria bacterium]|nr:hypothetical protein [Alphaproteobacteria bacterium]